MPFSFEPIKLEKQNEYRESWTHCPQKASDYSFVNLWAWKEAYGLFWAWAEDHVWIKQTKPFVSLWSPVGSWEENKMNACFEKYFGIGTRFTRVPEMFLEKLDANLKDELILEEARGHWDYLYSSDELIQLKGNRFHKKKNLLNQFKKNYEFRYVPLAAEIVQMAKEMQEDWCTWRDCESSELLNAENGAIARVLDDYEKLTGLLGGALFVDEKMVAYTVGEKVMDDIIIIHFEKGSSEYKGIYQAISQMFLEHSCKNIKTVNREQDLDDVGLRKAKLSYNPTGFIKKYNAIRS